MIRLSLKRKVFHGEAILGPIDLVIERGDRVAILGPSGIGKTTLLSILTGLDRQFEGKLALNARLGFAFQEPRLLPWRTARDNITIVTGASSGEAQSVLAAVGLAGKEDHLPGQLSLGQQRRLALARAFAVRPDVLVLDEAFASLDQPLVEDLLALTDRLVEERKIALLMVTHSDREAEVLARTRYRLGGRPAVLASIKPDAAQ